MFGSWFISGAAGTVALLATFTDWLTDIAFTLANATGALRSVLKVRDVDIGNGNADNIPTLTAQHLTVVNVLTKVLSNLATDDLFESRQITINITGHEIYPLSQASCAVRG